MSSTDSFPPVPARAETTVVVPQKVAPSKDIRVDDALPGSTPREWPAAAKQPVFEAGLLADLETGERVSPGMLGLTADKVKVQTPFMPLRDRLPNGKDHPPMSATLPKEIASLPISDSAAMGFLADGATSDRHYGGESDKIPSAGKVESLTSAPGAALQPAHNNGAVAKLESDVQTVPAAKVVTPKPAGGIAQATTTHEVKTGSPDALASAAEAETGFRARLGSTCAGAKTILETAKTQLVEGWRKSPMKQGASVAAGVVLEIDGARHILTRTGSSKDHNEPKRHALLGAAEMAAGAADVYFLVLRGGKAASAGR